MALKTKIDMAVKPVRYAPEPANLIGWIRVDKNRLHWLVRAPNGNIIGEIFQVQKGHWFYALVYGRTYPTPSGCVTALNLDELTEFMTGVALNRRT